MRAAALEVMFAFDEPPDFPELLFPMRVATSFLLGIAVSSFLVPPVSRSLLSFFLIVGDIVAEFLPREHVVLLEYLPFLASKGESDRFVCYTRRRQTFYLLTSFGLQQREEYIHDDDGPLIDEYLRRVGQPPACAGAGDHSTDTRTTGLAARATPVLGG